MNQVSQISTYPNKAVFINEWSQWFESKRDIWDLFTATVVFKSGGISANPDLWCDEYHSRVLNKVRKAIAHGSKNFINAIPFDSFFFYEKDESSIFRITGSRKPHHVHALIPIPKCRSFRFWSVENNDLQPRVRKDIESIDTVQSIHVDPVKESSTWIRYITKGKSI